MSAALRKALFWLLMLVIPLQGLAGAVMPLHASEAGMGRMHSASNVSAPMTMHAASSAHAVDPCAAMVTGCDQSHAPGALKCGLSAVCGLVAAPALQLPPFIPPLASQAARPEFLHLQVAFCTGAPERPPRILA